MASKSPKVGSSQQPIGKAASSDSRSDFCLGRFTLVSVSVRTLKSSGVFSSFSLATEGGVLEERKSPVCLCDRKSLRFSF